ncbi:arylamine N-acetyltransferase family protein [Rhodopila sp.]|jgi:N-hydroxyarylamine O-acetyltransferase|uniref:arylamine N-acetyltransferase family protein n=1 Tax=Rhodopila sp. TaxID=2480087 RepID=UPI002BB59BE6|nr:arylamine N-acetyltransferase [Rhodopila sp.]HVZ09486.1 arylamine N-acetyltransferase [Rhodopila sp.]
MALDLDAYLARIGYLGIGYRGALTPTLETLTALQRAHMMAIPFEGLDVLLGRDVSLDLDRLQAKLVGARRGGYCFEHTTLFAAVLDALGFRHTAHMARVLLVTPLEAAPLTHMLLVVDLPQGRFVSDPGFGGPAAPVPLPLSGETVGRHRIARDGAYWVLLDGDRPCWGSLLREDQPVDFEVGNHYVASHPASPFTQNVMMSRFIPSGQVTVMNREAKIVQDGAARTVTLPDRPALRAFVADHFGFDLPEIETLRVSAVPGWE